MLSGPNDALSLVASGIVIDQLPPLITTIDAAAERDDAAEDVELAVDLEAEVLRLARARVELQRPAHLQLDQRFEVEIEADVERRGEAVGVDPERARDVEHERADA